MNPETDVHAALAKAMLMADLLTHRLAAAYQEMEEPGCDLLADGCGVIAAEISVGLEEAQKAYRRAKSA